MFENKEGQNVPQVTFPMREDGEWVSKTSEDLFKGKKVILFSLPGAFTPTCSSTHLPRYNQLADTFKENGVDEILCLSVNDTFVMNAWKKDQDADQVRVIPDGNGEFTEKMGLLVDKGQIGFGKRSWRYSMLVNDGVIEKMFIEPEKDGDPFEVSDADTMLDYINSSAKKPKSITLFSKEGCVFCKSAKEQLANKNLKFEEIKLAEHEVNKIVTGLTGKGTVPQIFIDGEYIGGSDDLNKYLSNS
jgi:glutaredoxin-like protein